jgi:hypothetical protein
MNIFKTTASILIVALLSACHSGINQKLDTSHGIDAYRSSLNEAVQKMDKKEIEAFDWAVSDINFAMLNEKYPNATPKEIIRAEAEKVLDYIKKRRPELNELIPAFDAEVKMLEEGIKVVNPTFSVEKDFFGDQPKVQVKVQNLSPKSYTALAWNVELFINGQTKPVASTTIVDDYKDAGGIKSGYEYSRTYKLGFVTGNENFTTLEIQNSKDRLIKLTLLVDDCIELNGHKLGERNPHTELEQLDRDEAKAKLYKEI